MVRSHGDLEPKNYIVFQRSSEEYDAGKLSPLIGLERHINNDREFVVVQKRQQRQKKKVIAARKLKDWTVKYCFLSLQNLSTHHGVHHGVNHKWK